MEQEFNILGLVDLINDIHETAVEKGWWKKDKKFSAIISLIHSELSEALEFERSVTNLKAMGIDPMLHYTGTRYSQDLAEDMEGLNVVIKPTEIMSNIENEYCKKPDGILPELADAVIRVFDYIGYLGLSKEFVDIMLQKHSFNKTRPHMHGGKDL